MHIDYTKLINIMAILYALVLPLSRAGVSLFTVLLIVVWIAEGDFRRKWALLKRSYVVLALFTFIGFNFLSLLWTNDPLGSVQYIKKYWYISPIFILFTSLKREYMEKIISAFILGMFVSEMIAYGVFFELWSFKHATVENPSPFMHHIEYSVFLAFTALLLLSRIFNEKNIRYKIIYMIFFTTISGNLFLTAGRTGQLAFVLGLFTLGFVHFKNKFKAFFVSLFLTIFMIGIAFNLSTTFHDRVIMGQSNLLNVIGKQEYCTSLGGRIGSYIISKEIIGSNPILGVGIIDNMKVFHSIIDNKYPEMKCMHELFMHTHNQFIEVLTQMGFMGLILFISVFYMIAKIPLTETRYKNMKYIYLTVILVSFIPEVLFHRQFSMALFALIIGLLLAEYRIENEI